MRVECGGGHSMSLSGTWLYQCKSKIGKWFLQESVFRRALGRNPEAKQIQTP